MEIDKTRFYGSNDNNIEQKDLDKNKSYVVKYVNKDGLVMKQETTKFICGFYDKDFYDMKTKYIDKEVIGFDNEIWDLQNKRIRGYLIEVDTIEYATKEQLSDEDFESRIEEFAYLMEGKGFLEHNAFETDVVLDTPIESKRSDLINSAQMVSKFSGGWNWLNDHWEYLRVLEVQVN